jgi:hypothetical protein
MRITTLAFLGLSLVAACRGGGNGGGDDDDVQPDGPPVGGDVNVQQIQDDAMPVDTPVELRGVVVTAIDTFGTRTGDMWVQEPGGGEFSGVKVFGAPLDQIASLVPGDIITIAGGVKEEFALSTDTSGRTVTEVGAPQGATLSITKTGTGAVPAPTVVDALAIDMLADDAAKFAEWEKWEGVLITVTKARQLGAIDAFGAGDDQKQFSVTGLLRVQSALADLGAGAVANTCYTSITGVGDYFFNYLLHPRATTDIISGGTDCAVQQVTTATIPEIQTGTAVGLVEVNDVFITAISFNKKNVWVSQSLTAAPNEGIFVFLNGAVLGTDFVVGAKVNIAGTVVENNNDANGDTTTQIANGATMTFVAAPTAAPVPLTGKTAAELTVAATGEPFESVLVTLANVKVNAAGNQGNFGVGQLQQSGTTFLSDDDVFRILDVEVGKCYATITGLWTYQVFDNVYGFLPLAVGTGIGTCN